MGLDPLSKALDELHKDFKSLSNWEPFGYLGGPLPGEKAVTQVPVYFTGRMLEGIRLLASHPELPYEASPSKLVQHATFVLASHLAGVLAEKGPEYTELQATLRYDKVVAQAQERQRKEGAFRSILAAREEALQEALRPPASPVENLIDILRDLKMVALAATEPLRGKLSRVALRNPTVERAIKAVQHEDPQWVNDEVIPWAEMVFTEDPTGKGA